MMVNDAPMGRCTESIAKHQLPPSADDDWREMLDREDGFDGYLSAMAAFAADRSLAESRQVAMRYPGEYRIEIA